ncbi:MAG TPA: tetratricopeptide repeat protein [Gemmatimonadales bacterium]|nr:tetratricopeptide repeat protein [Gemmatimonadales bacterium]
MTLEKLKDTARKFEQKEDWRRAIDVYLKAIQQIEAGKESAPDLSLYNRVGDLYLKVGDTASAVRHYDRAVDLYADQGFFNNAIALCGKILRVNPGRTVTYLNLARLHARKNVVIEAKRNLLEFIERMNAQGQLDEAFAAVKTFADQFSGSQDIRVMLIELLRAASRSDEAREQLEKLSSSLEALGGGPGSRAEHGAAAADADTRGRPEPGESRGNGLVFLDTGFGLPSEPVRSTDRIVDETPLEPLVPDGLMVAGADISVPELGGFEATVLDPTGLEPEPVLLDSEPLAPDHEGLGTPWLDPAVVQDSPDPIGELNPATAAEFERIEPVEFGATGKTPAEPLVAGGGAVDLTFIEVPATDEPAVSAPTEPAAGGTADIVALERAVADRPDDPAPHRALAEALVQSGATGEAVYEFRIAAQGYEGREAWDQASDTVERIIALEPDVMGHYQKLVELAFRSGDRGRLIEAYLRLADVLVTWGDTEKARAVYGRVLDHDAANAHALSALAALDARVSARAGGRAAASPAGAPPDAVAAPPPGPEPGSAFVDLGSLVLDEHAKPRDTRMRVEGRQPIEDEQRAFEEALAEFKRGIERNLAADDYQAHYDLGVAFKEMGLLDEAIAEFQKALRAPEGRLRTSEALGTAFFEKGQFAIAETVLRRAVDTLDGADDAKIGLLYWLGRAAEELGRAPDALIAYERALAVDIRFMDVDTRVRQLRVARA